MLLLGCLGGSREEAKGIMARTGCCTVWELWYTVQRGTGSGHQEHQLFHKPRRKGIWGFMWLYTPHTTFLGGYIRITLSVHPFICQSVNISCKGNCSLTDELILILSISAVHDLMMCMQEDNPSSDYFKGNNH